MARKWVIKDPPDPEVVAKLSSEINVNPVLTGVLVQRGIDTFEKARSFFRPSLANDLHDPTLMKGMNQAVQRLRKAITRSEEILLYGDYDVDGTTAVALVYGILKGLTSNVQFYLPDRYVEGYGISEEGITFAEKHKCSLLISLDCGIRAVDLVESARTRGIDTIICDHHIPGEILPPAVAILDPKQEDCGYPYKELTGCGIGFKLMQALVRDIGHGEEELERLLYLLAISVAADIVPITGENRVLAFHGLKQLNEDPGKGIRALTEVGGLSQPIDISGVVFGIAPRINAAGRIGHASNAVKLMVAEDDGQVDELCQLINEQNTQRREFDEQITKEALEMIDRDESMRHAKSTVVYKDDWHKGVVGIVASRLMESYYRPTIVLTESNGWATGSARSVFGFSIYNAINQCRNLLEKFGGHEYAAGLTLPVKNVEIFRKEFEDIVSQSIDPDLLTPVLRIDERLDFDRINHKFYRILKQMAPFGPRNPSPTFLTENVVCSNVRVLKEDHLKLFLRQEGSKKTMEAIAFRMSEYLEKVQSGKPFAVAYHVDSSTFDGANYIQLVIKDFKFADPE